MKIEHLITLVATALITVACQSKNEQWYDPNECDFLTEKHRIKVNYEYKYDIISTPALFVDDKGDFEAGIKMEIFNYGEKLQINECYVANIFSPALAPSSHYYIVSPEDISITNRLFDETYGEWAKGHVVVSEFNRYIDNAFISPLAYNYIQEKQNDDDVCLVLVRLISIGNNSTFNGVFLGDFYSKHIISSDYQHVKTETLSIGTCYNNEFWQPLLTDEEYKTYKDYLKWSQLGLLSSSYELPKNITYKITR